MIIGSISWIVFCAGSIIILTSGIDNIRRIADESIRNTEARCRKTINVKAEAFRSRKKKAAVEKEIYQSAALLENIIILQKESPKGAAYIIEQIAAYSSVLRKPFESMMYYVRLNQKEAAVNAFEAEAGTAATREYANILIRMDSIAPSELRENVSMLRKRLKEEAITREKKKNETISDLIYIPVLANVMVIFVNFIYISYYAEQKELFQQLLF